MNEVLLVLYMFLYKPIFLNMQFNYTSLLNRAKFLSFSGTKGDTKHFFLKQWKLAQLRRLVQLKWNVPPSPVHFWTDTPIQALWASPFITQQIIFPSKPFFIQHAKLRDPVTSLFIRLPAPPSQFWTGTPSQALWASTLIPHQVTCPSKPFLNLHISAVSQSRHSSSDSSFINDSPGIKQFFSASYNASSATFFTSWWKIPISKLFLHLDRRP